MDAGAAGEEWKEERRREGARRRGCVVMSGLTSLLCSVGRRRRDAEMIESK